jgi:chromosome segregation ATPase
MADLSDRIFGEIERLEDEIERYRLELSICRQQLKQLVGLLENHNIPVPDLATEAKEMKKKRVTEELGELMEELSNFEKDKAYYESSVCDTTALDDEEKWNRDHFNDQKWVTKHSSYLNNRIRKMQEQLTKLTTSK